MALFFSMAQGSSKWLAARSDQGWYLVNLERISTEKVAADDPLIALTQPQMRPAIAREYPDQLVAAMRKEFGVERHDAALAAVRKPPHGETCKGAALTGHFPDNPGNARRQEGRPVG